MRLDLLVGSGGVLSHAPRRAQSMLMMIDAFQVEGVTELAVDSIFMMPHLGVLSTIHPAAATEVFEKDCLVRLGTCVAPAVEVQALPDDNGRHLRVTWTRAADVPADAVTAIVRRAAGAIAPDPVIAAGATLTAGEPLGAWTIVAVLDAGERELIDEVAAGVAYHYAVAELRRAADGAVIDASPAVVVGPRTAEAAFLHRQRLAIGRSTEMGRPVLYVTGLEEIQNIQTIASLLILGHIAEKTAQYDTELIVANYFPLTMVVAEEVVRQGYANAGRLDAHRPDSVLSRWCAWRSSSAGSWSGSCETDGAMVSTVAECPTSCRSPGATSMPATAIAPC